MNESKARILITGGCGFIGHHFVEHILKYTKWDMIILDKLSYASLGYDRLRDIKVFDNKRILLLTADFAQEISEGCVREIGEIDYIVHMGANTHVDRSITDPKPFVEANVMGTMHMLDLARKLPNLKKFVYFSTDEVFGPAPEGVAYKEWDCYNSRNPYAATKAAGEELCLAYGNTFKIPVVIMHTMNVFGERQHHEKYIPMVIRSVLNGDTVTIHADPTRTKAGSRFYIHARNVASAILFLLDKGQTQDKYNIVGEQEVDNLALAQMIADHIGKPLQYDMVDFHSSRPGHDLRYALDGSKMEGMGWTIPKTFESSLKKTIDWCLANPGWLASEKDQEDYGD